MAVKHRQVTTAVNIRTLTIGRGVARRQRQQIAEVRRRRRCARQARSWLAVEMSRSRTGRGHALRLPRDPAVHSPASPSPRAAPANAIGCASTYRALQASRPAPRRRRGNGDQPILSLLQLKRVRHAFAMQARPDCSRMRQLWQRARCSCRVVISDDDYGPQR